MQLEELTEQIARKQLNTKFSIPLEERRVDLELTEVMGAENGMPELEGTERFSLYFLGPGDFYLPQRIYRMEHDELGELDMFIVPVSKDKTGYRYEAVFSRLIR